MGKKNILVIDDDEFFLATIRDLLEKGGYEVSMATSGLEANRFIYGERPPDLILLDIVMPYLSGTKKVVYIKERESSKDIPIILMSSKSRAELEKLTRSSGADGFIEKPVTKERLFAEVSRLI